MNNTALIYMLFFSVFRAIDILLAKWVYMQGIDPVTWILYTYIFALCIWGSYLSVTKTFSLKQLTPSLFRPLICIGVSAAGGTIFSYLGLQLTAAVNYSFLAQISAVFTIVLAHIWFKDEKITWIKSMLICVFLLGVYLVSTNGARIIPQGGDLFVILGAFFFAINNVTIKHSLQHGGGVEMIILVRHVSTACLACIAIFFFAQFQWIGLSFLGYALLSATLLCVWLYALNKVVEHSSPSYMTMMAMTNPLLIVFGAYVAFGEIMDGMQIIGGFLILSAGIVLEYVRRKDGHKVYKSYGIK